jgi:DNA-binding response OmpR family regulator
MQILLFSQANSEASILKFALQQSGFWVRINSNLEANLENWTDHPVDGLLVCETPEYPQALELVKEFRAVTFVPLVVLTDMQPETDLIDLYQAGADLVVIRPFSIQVLILQMRTLILRSNSMPLMGLPSLEQGDLTLDPTTRTVTVGSNPKAHLTQLEFRLLYTLMTHPGQIMSPEELVEKVWGYSGEGNRDLVRGLVLRLRAKVESDSHEPVYIHTEPGAGYYFRSILAE